MKLKASMITGAMDAEAALAKEKAAEFDETLDAMSDDSPLKIAANSMKKLMGDLGGLPPGHPLLVAMEEARQRYEAEEAAKAEAEANVLMDDSEDVELKRAKRLDEKKAARAERDRAEERKERQRTAAKNINATTMDAMDSLKRLSDNINASLDDFAGDRYALMKLERLQRVTMASLRGLSESKINPGRVTNG